MKGALIVARSGNPPVTECNAVPAL